MTELEKKLKKLGYKYDGDGCYQKDSDYDKSISQVITLNNRLDEIMYYCVVVSDEIEISDKIEISAQEKIDNIQMTFDDLMQDFKGVRK